MGDVQKLPHRLGIPDDRLPDARDDDVEEAVDDLRGNVDRIARDHPGKEGIEEDAEVPVVIDLHPEIADRPAGGETAGEDLRVALDGQRRDDPSLGRAGQIDAARPAVQTDTTMPARTIRLDLRTGSPLPGWGKP